MKITCDPSVDALYIRFKETTVTTEHLTTKTTRATIHPIPDTWPVAAHIATLRHHLPDLARQYRIKLRCDGMFCVPQEQD